MHYTLFYAKVNVLNILVLTFFVFYTIVLFGSFTFTNKEDGGRQMTELAREIKALARRVKSKEVSFLQVLMEMTLCLDARRLSANTSININKDPELVEALSELSKELHVAFVTQRVGIESMVQVLIERGVGQGKLDASFFQKVINAEK